MAWRTRTRKQADERGQVTHQFTDMAVDKSIPRGYRNNNPLNMRISSSAWQGKIPVENNTDGAFEQFISMAYGYRAAMKLLGNYVTKYKCDTLAKMISRWAPSNENNTDGYISRVCKTTGFTPDTHISPQNHDQMTSLAYAMSLVENGTKMLPDRSAIEEGWQLL